jgi:hypothetical protein
MAKSSAERINIMTAYHTLTDASGRSVADHAERLGQTLDGLAVRVRDAIAVAVGSAVDGAVQAAVRATLAELLGTAPADRVEPSRSYTRSSYWDEPDDGWGRRYHDPFEPTPVERATDDAPDRQPRRWVALVLLGGRLLADWLRRRPLRPRWRTIVCAGLVAGLAVAVGPSAGLARSALGLTALAAGLRTGGGFVGSFMT